MGVPLTLFDTQGLELDIKEQDAVIENLIGLIRQQRQQGVGQEIHIVYYCINAMMGRIEALEIALIEALAKEVPVILTLTQSLGDESEEFLKVLEEYHLPVKAIIPLLAYDYKISNKQKVFSHSLQKLIDTTLAIIPSKAHQAFINAQRIDINLKVKQAKSWAMKYTKTAFGVGFTPIPIADASILVPMQITMLGQITAIFGLSLDKSQLVSVLAGIGGTSGATMIGKMFATSFLKFLPGVGPVSGSLITGATASGVTLTLAYAYIEVLKRIANAEMMGRDVGLKEISKWMSQSVEEQAQVIGQFIPDSIKDSIPDWMVSGFFHR